MYAAAAQAYKPSTSENLQGKPNRELFPVGNSLQDVPCGRFYKQPRQKKAPW